MKYIIPWVVVFFSAAVEARLCVKKDNRDILPNGFLRTPRDQDGAGWCYAYALADLISAKIKEPISANYLSINFAYQQLRSIDKSGEILSDQMLLDRILNRGATVRWAWDSTKMNGRKICSEIEMPTNSQLFVRSDQDITQERENYINFSLSTLVYQRSVRTPVSVSCQSFFWSGRNQSDLQNLISSTARQSLTESLKQISDNVCHTDKKVSESVELFPKRNEKGRIPYFTGEEMIKQIDDQLEKDGIAAISYDISPWLADLSTNGGTGNHASVIVGRQMYKGQCGYVVRNSWGQGCEIYNKKTKPFCNPEEGTFWVSEEELKSNLQEVNWLE